MKISHAAIKRPVTTLMLVLMILVLGGVSFMGLPIDMFPDIKFPIAVISTSYDGAGPKEVETLITRPIEEVMGTVNNFKKVSSSSTSGASMVMVEFTQGTDMDFAALQIREKIDMIKDVLPEDASAPMVFQFDPDLIPIVQFSMSNGDDLVSLKNLAEDKIKSRLERLDGVASVGIVGGLEREIKVNLIPQKMAGYGLSQAQVINSLRMENLNMPGGEVKEGKSQFTVRTMGEFNDVKEIVELPIPIPGGIIRLGDIAEIEDGYKDSKSSVYMNDKPCLLMQVQKQSGTNTVKVADRINRELDKISAEMKEVKFITVFDQSVYIKRSIGTVASNAIIGGILAILILFIFLKNFRTTFIIATSIPISIIATFVLVFFNGITLNMMSLGGLALGVGMLVDNSIVVLESIYRYRENGYSRAEAAKEGSSEVAMAITASTLTTIAVFLPIAFIRDNLAIELFREMALTVTFSLAASLVVSLTLVPMLASKILKVSHAREMEKDTLVNRVEKAMDKAIAAVEDTYGKMIRWALSHRKKVILGTVVLLILSIAAAAFLTGVEFFPNSDEGMFQVNVELPKGYALEETSAMMDIVEEKLKALPEMDYCIIVEGASGNEFGGGSDSSMGQVHGSFGSKIKRDRSIDDLLDEMRSSLKGIPGVKVSVQKVGTINPMGGAKPISVEIKGDDLGVLKSLADELSEGIKKVEGAREVTSSVAQTVPEVQVKVDRRKASQYGISAYTVANTVQTAIMGQTATRYKVSGDEIDVRVRLSEDYRKDLKDLESIVVSSPVGQQVPLYEIADIAIDQSPISIDRINQVRTVTVTGDISGRTPGEVSVDVQRIIDSMKLPHGYEIKLGGVTEDMMEAGKGFGLALALAVILVYMIMACQFESLIHPLVIMFSVPLAIIGVCFAMAAVHKPFSVPAFTGIIILAGIVVNNAIVLIDYINTLRGRGMERDEAIIKAGPVRLRPILMTTLTTVLGLVPLAMGIGEGAEMQAPMAVTVIGGLTFSTLLTLVFIPVIYTIFEDWGNKLKSKFGKKKAAAAATTAG